MDIREQLHETERALGFTYPPSFVSGIEDFSTLLASEGFRLAFSDVCPLFSTTEITETRDHIPDTLIPFMREEQPSWPDIYAFDLGIKRPEFRVVVWSDHAIVMDWESFPAFLRWVHEHIAKYKAGD